MHSKNLTANGLTRWQGAIAKLLVLSLLLVGARNALAGASTIKAQLPPEEAIVWNKWSLEVFARAKREDKMLLVNVGIEVCFACRWMEEFTYRDPQVARLVMENFIPVQVDADDRPDIGERYSDWAWPATIFLAPNATQVLALSGNRRPPDFIPILKELMAQHAKGELKTDALAPYAAPPKPEQTDLTKIRDGIRKGLDDDFDDAKGGWRDELKEINGSGRFVQLFIRAQSEGDRLSRERAIKTAYAMLARIDPVWGGFFSAGINGWASPIYEKRTGSEATALETFAYAYHQTRDKRFLTAAKDVERYLRDWMMAEDGTFFTSQQDEPPKLPKNWSLRRYYNLDTDAKRRKYGTPPIDHAVYTDLNARVIVGYTQLYEASGDDRFLHIAQTAAHALLKQRQQAAGWILQSKETKLLKQDERIHLKTSEAKPFLRAQVQFGVALLSLYRVSGETDWLKAAQRLADGMRATLEDPQLGGFYASTSDGTDAIAPRRKPLQENGVAARFLYQLGQYTKQKSYSAAAERAIRAVSVPSMVAREGRIVDDLAVALETITAEYVEFTVVGDASQPQAQALFTSGRNYYEPRKILHYEQPGRYPDLGRPAMFVCTPNACSTPIFEAKDVAKQADRYHRDRTATQVPENQSRANQ